MTLIASAAAEIVNIVLARNGFVETRVGFALELYLLKGETVETRLALCSMLREYHALFPDRISHVDANRLTKVQGEAISIITRTRQRAWRRANPWI